MNLAIVHYHLNRGGVTRVIENQLRALDAVLDADVQAGGEPWRVAIFYGGRRKGWIKKVGRELRSIQLVLVEIPGLEYDSLRDSTVAADPEELAKDLRLAFERQGFAAGTTVVHVHNHALGKNRALPTAVARLAEQGFPVLLQVHDFAEDFRPANYRWLLGGDSDAARLYPQADDIHYAALNSRDHDILAAAGVAPERLDLLPNPVPPLVDMPKRKDARHRLQQFFGVPTSDRYLLYPIRCIRRKNVGEALLYSALAPQGTVVGMTLAPLNPIEVPIHEAWKDCARRSQLPCRFEVGAADGLTFPENLAAADAIITTSLAEGFGMVFLESWLAGRPLIGRDLPEITADFRSRGVEFDWLGPALKVPLDWPGADRFSEAFFQTYRNVLEAYGRREPDDLDAAFASKTANGMVDFGDLDEPLQQAVIERVCSSARNRDIVLEANPWLAEALNVNVEAAADVIERNTRAIRVGYSLASSGQSLLRLYEKVQQTRPQTAGQIKCQPLPNADAILDSFLDPRRFRLIRS